MSSRADGSPLAALSGMGIALAAPAALLLPTLPAGGLAPLVVAAVIALVLGVPAAVAEWRTPAAATPTWRTLGNTLSELVVLAVISGSAAPWVATAGWGGIVLLPAGWAAAWALSQRSVRWQLAPAVLAVLGAGVAGGLALATEPRPYTLLAPTWSTWPVWAGPAAVAGLWTGGVGHGQWSFGAPRKPGQNRAPWAGAGLATLGVLGLAAHRASLFERVEPTGPDVVTGVVMSLAAVSAAAVILARKGDARPRLAFGVIATGWLSWPAAAISAFAWGALLPWCMAGAVALVGQRQDRTARPLTLVVGAMLVGGAVLGWPGIPQTVAGAVLLGISITAGFWIVGTRAMVSGAPVHHKESL